MEIAQSCPQCQMGSDYGHRQKTTRAIQSQGPWDTLSVDIVGPLPADHRQEFLIVFVDCYSRYTILVPSSNHTASNVSEALLWHVVPYFGTPRRLLSDRGRKFVGDVWGKLMRSLGIQHVLKSPYHLEGNAMNERSHRTLNNMLRTLLLEGTSSKAWVEKVPGIMLALNAMSHEPHGFSASMVATGRELTLPPDVQHDAQAIGKFLSRSAIRKRPPFVPAVGSCTNSIRSHLVFATLPPTFSRLMDRVLSGLHWETCLFYLDDIIVFSSTWEEHLARLRQVFQRLRHADLKLGVREMYLCSKRGQLSGSPGHRGRPSARLCAPRSHSGDSTS